MLNNIESVDDLRGLARSKSSDYVTKTVNLSFLDESLKEGWLIEKKYEKSVRLKKKKPCDVDLADRVWSLLYRMGFNYLNSEGDALLKADSKDPNSQTCSINVVGIDTEVGLAIMCKSPENNQQLRQELDQYILIRQRFAQSVNQQFSQPFDRHVKRQVALAMFTFNVLLSEDDKKRAKEGNISAVREIWVRFYFGTHLAPVEVEVFHRHGALRIPHPDQRYVARTRSERQAEVRDANFRDPHVHLKPEV